MKSTPSATTTAAIALLALLSIGSLITGLDLALHFLPTNIPAIEHLHAASLLGKSLWVSAGFLGMLSIFAQLRRPTLAAGAAVAFATAYVPGANLVWLYFTPGCWLAIVIVTLTIFAHRAAMKSSQSIQQARVSHATDF